MPKEIVREIERYKILDKNYWRVYGLGLKSVLGNIIYQNWETCENMPEGGEIIYGLDFGYNNPSALVKICVKDDDIYAEELLYRKSLANRDLINQLKELKITGLIYADSAEPQRIEEISREEFYILPAMKEVNEGIDFLKSRKIYVIKNSVNLLKEIKNYSWKSDKDGKLMDEPIKIDDHLLDAMRYAVYSHYNKPSVGFMWLGDND